MKNKHSIIIYIIGIVMTTIISYTVMQPLIHIDSSLLVIDAIVTGLLLVGILMVLKNIVRYSNLPSLYPYQRVTVYIALAVLFVLCSFGVGLFALYLVFPFDDWLLLLHSAPLRIVIGVLVYGSAIQWYLSFYKSTNEIVEDTYQDDKNNYEPSSIVLEDEAIPSENVLERIAVKNGQKIDVVLVSEIIHLQAEGDYVMIHSQKGKFLKEQTMKSFENLLPSGQFVRVHRSSIVNVDFISQIELFDKQNQLLKMQNGAQIRVSVNGYKALKKTLQLK